MQYIGVITRILPVRTGTSKAGKEWKSIEFCVQSSNATYSHTACFTLMGEDRVSSFQLNFKEGQNVLVDFEIDSHEYNGRVFNSINAWKVSGWVPQYTAQPGVLAQGAQAPMQPMGVVPQPMPYAQPAPQPMQQPTMQAQPAQQSALPF